MILRLGYGFHSFNKNNTTNYSGEKQKYNDTFRGVQFLEDAKNLSVKSCAHGRSVLF